MADKRISELSAAVAALATDEIPVSRQAATSTQKVTAQQIADLASATSAQVATSVQVASAAATSADAHAAAASAAATSADAHAAAASAAATSVLTYVCATSARTTADASVKGLQSVVDALSSRISAAAGGGGSVTSAEVQTASAAATSVDGRVTSVGGQLNALSTVVSVLVEMDRRRVVADAQTIAGALTNVSGMCVAVSAGGTFRMEAMLLVDRSAVMSGPTRFGLTYPSMTKTRGEIHVVTTALFSAGQALFAIDAIWDGDSGSGSIIASVTVSAGAVNMLARYTGLFVVANSGNIVLQAGNSATITNGISILQGSYMHVFRLA